MRVLVVGLGSMGKRRAGLLQGLGHTVAGVDSAPLRRREAEALGIEAFGGLSEAMAAQAYGAGFVCTAPLSHAALTSALLDAGLSVFSELNLVADGYESAVEKAKEKGLTLFLSSTMLYRAEPRYITDTLREFNKPVHYIYHIGQYLPDWHPWESYKNFFVAKARTGGVREILGIELPWLTGCFGPAQAVCAHGASLSALELAYEDSLQILLRHQGGATGVLCADVVCPKAVRHFEVYGEGLHLFWEGNPKALFRYNADTKEKQAVEVCGNYRRDMRYSDNIVEDAYLDEVRHFFEVLRGEAAPLWSFEQDAQVVRLMDDIEAAAKGGRE